MEVGVLRRIQPQALGGHKPTAAICTINHAAGFQLRQALAHRNPRGIENSAQLAF